MKLQWLKAIIALPFNATVTIPFIILFFTDNLSFSSGAFPIVFGALIFFAGLFLAVWTMLLFAKIGKGTLAPWAPTKKLVVSGPYSRVRNPMLSGVIMMIMGEAAVFASLGVFIWGAAFFIINTFYFKYSEEIGLEKRFGEEYARYKKNVPRWIPRITKWEDK